MIGIAAFTLAASTSPRVTGVEARGAFKQNTFLGGFSFFKFFLGPSLMRKCNPSQSIIKMDVISFKIRDKSEC